MSQASRKKSRSRSFFSGDLGNKGIPIMRDPTIIDGCDYLVIESTYGDRLHANNEDKVERFVKIINDTAGAGRQCRDSVVRHRTHPGDHLRAEPTD